MTRLAAALAASALLACATAPAPAPAVGPADGSAVAPPAPADNIDPLQGFNRAMFWFDDRVLDRFFYAPLAHGWSAITPLTLRTHLEQFFDNLNFPGYFVQPLLQGDPKQSGVALSRFAINTTVGIAGIFDPANHYLGLARRPEDMGQTFGVWGIPPGPYLVLPLIAPASCVRDVVGMPIDWILNVGDGYFWPWFAPYGETIVRDVNRRALVDENLTAAREAAVDWYSSARDLYLQHREREIRNADATGEQMEAPSDDLYNTDESEKHAQ
ncbi:MAG: VacJ family lipoprotein [Myxococcota bacterium]